MNEILKEFWREDPDHMTGCMYESFDPEEVQAFVYWLKPDWWKVEVVPTRYCTDRYRVRVDVRGHVNWDGVIRLFKKEWAKYRGIDPKGKMFDVIGVSKGREE